MANDTLKVAKGLQADFLRQVLSSEGNEFTDADTPFLDTDTLSCVVWPGDDRAATLTVTPTWSDADTGQYYLSFTAANTTSLATGIYRFRTTSTRGGTTGPIDEGRIEILAAPGTAAAALAFATYDQMLMYGGPALAELLAESDQTGFLEQRARATEDLIEKLVTSVKPYRGGLGDWLRNGSGLYWTGDGNNEWLRQQLVPLEPDSTAPDTLPDRESTQANFVDATLSTALLLHPFVGEIVARTAAAYVFEDQAGRDSEKNWWALADFQRQRARSLLLSRRFSIDLSIPQTGYPSITVDLGNTSLR